VASNALEVCDVAEPPPISAGMRMCVHSVHNATMTGVQRRSHVPAASLPELAHAVTRGPLGAERRASACTEG
jgi:hypothetical protein